MSQLVQIHKNDLLTTTLVVADGMGIEHRAVMTLVNKYKDRLESRGILTFEMSKKTSGETRGRRTKYAIINESQFLFLCTLMRNSEQVLDFKDKLTKEFMRQRNIITEMLAQRKNQEWVEQRAKGKIARRTETDCIQEFVEYAKAQGSTHSEKYYVALSKAQNKALFIVEHKFPNLREMLNTLQLITVSAADIIVAKALKEGMEQGLHYKDIYKLAKQRLESFAEIVGQTLVPVNQLTLK